MALTYKSVQVLTRQRGKSVKSLSLVENFFVSRLPLISSLRIRIAAVINVFIAIRGLQALLDSDTAIVMRKGYQTFVTKDISKIDQTVLAVVFVKDLECHKRLKTIQTNHLSFHNTLNRTVLDDVADETARRLIKEVGKISGL